MVAGHGCVDIGGDVDGATTQLGDDVAWTQASLFCRRTGLDLSNVGSTGRAAASLVCDAGRVGDADAQCGLAALSWSSNIVRRRRSKPTTTWSPMAVTGTPRCPDSWTISWAASGSAATFFSVNSMPRRERNSFVW